MGCCCSSSDKSDASHEPLLANAQRSETFNAARARFSAKPTSKQTGSERHRRGSAVTIQKHARGRRARKKTSSSRRVCGVCGKAVYALEAKQDSREKWYHAECLKCTKCHGSLEAKEPFTAENTQGLFCRRCFQSRTFDRKAAHRLAAHKSAGPAGVVDHAGFVKAKSIIADTLDLDALAAHCAYCGGLFSASDEIAGAGTPLVHHSDCTSLGPGPGRKVRVARKTPCAVAQLVALTAPRLTLRLHVVDAEAAVGGSAALAVPRQHRLELLGTFCADVDAAVVEALRERKRKKDPCGLRYDPTAKKKKKTVSAAAARRLADGACRFWAEDYSDPNPARTFVAAGIVTARVGTGGRVELKAALRRVQHGVAEELKLVFGVVPRAGTVKRGGGARGEGAQGQGFRVTLESVEVGFEAVMS